MDVSKMCELNRYKLTDEAEMSAGNLQSLGSDLAQARAARDRAEVVVKTTKAAVELEVRKNDPKLYGLDKFTEASITAVVESSEDVVNAREELLKAQEGVYVLEMDYAALKDKSDMIKELDKQWASGYFAGPTGR